MLTARYQEDERPEIGIDEAGRGSFWGPLMAGAVCLPPVSEWTDTHRAVFLGVRDSKKLSPKKRGALALSLRALLGTQCAVGSVSAEEINRHGITWANREAFRRAIQGVGGSAETHRLLIDGTLAIDDWKGDQHVIIEGDGTYLAIAAASILAKEEHDAFIRAYAETDPECEARYHIVSSKGYGTAKHREGIKTYGGHVYHREAYIANWLPDAPAPLAKPVKTVKRAKDSKESQGCLIRFSVS
jgi:ribonuclease HII